MSGGRTIWWPKDTAWHRRERIVALGEEFGALGPLVIDWLSCEAKIQDDAGRVKSGVRSVARGCYSDAVTVGHVLSRAVLLGQLEDFAEADGLFECRISGWAADNTRGGATIRKQRQRDADEGANGSTEPDSPAEPKGHDGTGRDMSRPVPSSHLRGEKRRGTKSQSTTSPDSREDVLELSNQMAAAIKGNDPKAKANPTSKGWLDPIRLLIDRDGRTPGEIGTVIDFCAGDDFERRNVLCPDKLRKRFDQLILKANEQGPRAQFGDSTTPRRSISRPVPVTPPPAGDCPGPVALATDWAPVDAHLRRLVGEDNAALVWLSKLHLHELTPAEAVIGCPAESVGWIRGRFGRLLETAVGEGRTVQLVGCATAREMAAA